MRFTPLLTTCILLITPFMASQSAKRKAANHASPSLGQTAFRYTSQVVAFGPRYLGSPGHAKVEQFIKSHLKNADLQTDEFTMNTPLGAKPMRNYIAKYPGTKDGIIVIAGHYDTLFGRNDFVGANDGGSSTGLPLALCDYYASKTANGAKLDGYSVWIVFFDAEEAMVEKNGVRQFTEEDSTYGSRHLAAKWKEDGTAKNIKALVLLDMIGDRDLQLEDETNSNVDLRKIAYQVAEQHGTQSHFFRRQNGMEDDHTPFAKIGVPVLDLIDYDYGYNNSFWHTPQDTIDKLSPASFQIVGDVVIGIVQTISQRNGIS